jgi:glutathione S-transferase
MILKLHFHPLSSYCWKVLIALYEKGVSFEKHIVNLGVPGEAAAFRLLSPMGKMPVLRDEARSATVTESSIIIEYLERHYPDGAALLASDPDFALEIRAKDRFFDLYVHQPMQAIVLDRLRPPGKRDPYGVAQARKTIGTAYDILDGEMLGRRWAAGESFSMADCAAAPALFYASKVAPFGAGHQVVADYLARLIERPSFARTLKEAEPYFALFPSKAGNEAQTA